MGRRPLQVDDQDRSLLVIAKHLRVPLQRAAELLITNRLPDDSQIVIVWISDPEQAIDAWPVSAYNLPEIGKPMWWGGIPGEYQRLGRFDGEWPSGWQFLGWMLIGGDESGLEVSNG